MSNLPKVAIVGRPNVGKSALFNRMCGKRIAIVDEAEGITRDRLYAEIEFFGRSFEIIDTGGIDARSTAIFNDEVKRQAEIAIEEADALVLVVDGQVGMTDLDLEISRILHRTTKPLVLAVNKADTIDQDNMTDDFYGLGISPMIPVSAIQGRQLAELLTPIAEQIPDNPVESTPSTKLAIIGRPNVGKSTIVNSLINDDRCIVSPIAGTTRDSIDIAFQVEDRHYTLIDTAGIRKKKSEHEVVDKFAAIRTERAIERADICVLMLDAQQGLTSFDKKIAAQIEEAGKGCILMFNKWDLVSGHRMEHAAKAIRDEAHFLADCPMIFGSAVTGRNLPELITQVDLVDQAGRKRFSTPELNRFIEEVMQNLHPPMLRGKRLRIYYMTQIDTQPLRFLLFVNYPDLMAPSYERYLYNQFRKRFGCLGIPISFHLRGRGNKVDTDAHVSGRSNKGDSGKRLRGKGHTHEGDS